MSVDKVREKHQLAHQTVFDNGSDSTFNKTQNDIEIK